MANGGRTAGSRILVEKIVPSSAGWTEDPSNYNLLIDLPGINIYIIEPAKLCHRFYSLYNKFDIFLKTKKFKFHL